jgi:predicted Zn-dependent protease
VYAALFLPNLLAFVVGMAAALYYLRSGRVWAGAAATLLLWVLLDWWLVARYVWAADNVELMRPATLLQCVAAATAGALAWQLWRRRWSAVARARTTHFGDGLTAYLRSDYDAARAAFTRLVRSNPWDAAAWIALGDVWGRCGKVAKARRCYGRARAVDTQHAFADLLHLRLASAAVSARAPRS